MENKVEEMNGENPKIDQVDRKKILLHREEDSKIPTISPKSTGRYNQNYKIDPPKASLHYKNPINQAIDVNYTLDSLMYGMNKITRSCSQYPGSTNVTSGYLKNYSSLK